MQNFQQSKTDSSNAGVVESDSSRDEGAALPPLLYESPAQGAAQGPDSVV